MTPQRILNFQLLRQEVVFTTSRSSGPGGQNVNKVNSKVTLKWDVGHSEILTEEEKEVISKKLHSRITAEGVLLITSQDNRSQIQNKEDAIGKLETLLMEAFKKKKKRKPTKPSKGAVQNRIEKKKKNSEKKQWRQKID